MKSRAIALSLLLMTLILGLLAIYMLNFEYTPIKSVTPGEKPNFDYAKSEKGIAMRIMPAQETVEGRAFYVKIEISNDNCNPIQIVTEECTLIANIAGADGRRTRDITSQFTENKGTFPEILPARHESFPSPSVSFYADLLSLLNSAAIGPVSIQMTLMLKFANGGTAQIQSNTINTAVPPRRHK